MLACNQTDGVLLRPYCVLEVNAAIDAKVPIVALHIRGKGYGDALSPSSTQHITPTTTPH